jgi:capsular exopolysaccharide synthesis family protein
MFSCAVGAGLLLGILWPRLQTPVYRARASVEVFQKTGADAPVDAVPTEAFVRTQIKILESESLAARAAGRLDASESTRPEVKGWLAQLAERLSGTASTPPTPEQLAADVAGGMKVRTPDGTRLVEISFDCEKPSFCRNALEAIVDEFIATTAGTRENLTKETSSWLVGQLASMRRKLEGSEQALLNFAQKKGLVVLGDKEEGVAGDTLKQLHAELSRADVERLNKQSRRELAAAEPVSSLPEILDSNPLKQYEVQLTDLKRQFAEVKRAYLPDHPKYDRLQAQIAELEEAIVRERINIVKRIDNEHRSADRRRQLLEDKYTKQLTAVSRESRDLAQYHLLKRDVDLNRQVYEATLQRMGAYGIQSALHANHVRVIDHPKTPVAPYWPKKKWTVLLGVLAGVVVGFAGLLLTGNRVTTVQLPGQAAILVGAPALGQIPHAASSPRLGLLRRSVPAPARWNDPSFPADSFRSTLASLLLASGDQPRTLVVTSAIPREGKTTSTTHLAIALAEAGRNVLIIDADTRKPNIHKMFGISNTRGLLDLLAAPSGTDPSEFVWRADGTTLAVLPSGLPKRDHNVQALYSARWPELLAELRSTYDTILIDSPPLLNVPHARILGKLVDGVVLVVRANQTHRDAVAFARQRLADDGINLLGAILNNWRPDESSGYGYKGYYGRVMDV